LSRELQLDAEGRLPARRWTDNTGHFQVTGRLLLILEGQVRLLKETGRTTTVPLDRLSAVDRAYVQEVIQVHGADLPGLARIAAR
jgi:hypothetical protein